MDANSAGSMGVIKVLIYVNLWMPFPLVGWGGGETTHLYFA